MPMQLPTATFDALCTAYETGTWSRRFYFDAIGCHVVEVTEAERSELQAIYDDADEFSADVPPHLRQAHAVELDDVRFHKVPVISDRAAAELRSRFSDTVDPALRRLLWRALDANDPVWFEKILGMESAELRRWEAFKRADYQQTLTAWLSGLATSA